MASALLLIGCWGNHRNRYQHQASYARKLAPAQVGQRRGARHTETRTLRVRVYADAEYRSQVLRWKAKLAAQVARANEVIGPAFGVELEIVDAQPWQRSTSATDMMGMLSELERLDAGEDVDWVIGVVTQLSEVSSSLRMLGAARPLSPYLLIRGMNDIAERKTIDQVFDELDSSERERLYRARKAHKELTLLLHEWAHTLGAMHTQQPTAILNPSYNNTVAEFTPQNAKLMEIALRYRGQGALSSADLAERNKQLVEHVAGVSGHWLDDERTLLVQLLEHGPTAVATTPKLTAKLTPEGRKAFHRALDAVGQERWDDAFNEVLPLTEQYEDEPQVQLLGCRIAARARGSAYPTPELCQRAASLAPHDASPYLALARVHSDAKDDVSSLAELRKAHAALDAGGEQARADQWLALAGQYQRLELLTWTEQALAGAGDGDDADAIRQWITQTRRRYGLPADAVRFGVPPDREGAYLEQVKHVLALTYGSQYKKAQTAAKQLRKAFPKSPGLYVALCDFEIRIGKTRSAKRNCAKAIAAYDEAMWAHYLAGSIDANAKRYKRAAGHLKRAIELDPDMKALWKLLAKVYRTAGNDIELRELERAYRAKFNERL
jgi:tetratricopeptide (TPR) repeat protein